MDWDQAYNVTLDDGHAERAVWYHTPRERFRGGFRFLTLNALEDVVVFNVTCEIGFAPNMPDLRSGTGYFYAGDDDLLNRIWAIWPGDLGIQGPIAMMAYGQPGRESVRNSLATLFYYQNATTGMFPFAGPATGSFRSGARSDTYHSWALISMYDYAVWSGDEAWVAEHWGNITRGVEYITSRLDPDTGLQEQVNENDWARRNTGGFNSALNALNYHALNSLATLAQSGDQKQSWEEAAARIKKGYNDLLWDEEAGLYRDNPSSTLHAQDGNSLALLYGLAENGTQRTTYDAAYTSLAHGWSSGPTTALVTGVLGLRLEEIGGRRWSLRPQLGEELRGVRAGFETGLGWFEGKVTVGEGGDVEVEVVAPKGTKGRIVFPDEARGRVRVNGREFRGQLEETALVMDLEM
ncbi:unnamed protein product [Clonostachys rosea f. rosea IK726]|uniref:Uncharacterized protein n=1 Tax=Clonostachys rosea f. rosea IK726 TaxID=1349383 RepID=A0ACA9T8S4_BIOOC|nr:unnamed protein product [Clonostachys rosea f. rosea IK726]